LLNGVGGFERWRRRCWSCRFAAGGEDKSH
jgi:hypothetical protein